MNDQGRCRLLSYDRPLQRRGGLRYGERQRKKGDIKKKKRRKKEKSNTRAEAFSKEPKRLLKLDDQLC